VNVVNVTNITNITNVYNVRNGVAPLYRGARGYSNLRGAANNPRILNAVATVPANQFGRGPARHNLGVDAATFRQAGVLTGRVPVVPTRESLRPSDRPVNMSNRIATNQRFFSKAGAAPRPTPFRNQVAQMQTVMKNSAPRVTSDANRLGLGRQQPGRSMNTLPARAQVNTSSPQQFGRNAATPAQNPRQAQGNSAGRDWRRFGSDVAQNNGARMQKDAGSQRNATRVQENAAGTRASQQSGRPGWRSFSDRGGNQGSAQAGRNSGWQQDASRGSVQGQRNAVPRPSRNEQSPAGNQGGWRRFSDQPQSRSSEAGSPRNYGQSSGGTSEARPGWQRFPARSADSGGYRSQSGGASRYERPPLDLQQPIVTRRPSNGSYEGGRGSYGGNSGDVYRGNSGGNYGGQDVYRGGNSGGNYGGRDVYRGGNSGGSSGGRGASVRESGGGGGNRGGGYSGSGGRGSSGGGGGRGSGSAPRSSGPSHR
jgi:hypothetical protein